MHAVTSIYTIVFSGVTSNRLADGHQLLKKCVASGFRVELYLSIPLCFN